MAKVALTERDIRDLFEALNRALARRDVVGNLHLVGGAVMCLVHNARASTRDVDGVFVPSGVVREAAREVGLELGVDEQWLNDGVKGFFSTAGSFDVYLELEHLCVFCAKADYLLAMKCLAMRIGGEFHDEDDVRFLLRYLNIETFEETCEVIFRFYPEERFPQRTLYALEEMLSSA